MGWASERLMEIEEENQRKAEKLLDLPSIVERNQHTLSALEDRIIANEVMIESLHDAHELSQRWNSRLTEYLLAGSVGAIISLVLTIVFL